MILTGKKLTLRPLERQDLDRSRAWVNNPEIAGLLLRVWPVTEVEQENWFESLCTRPDRLVWAVLAQNNNHIGNVGLYNISLLHRRAEAWCLIGENPYRGQGLGQEAMELLLAFGFTGLGLNKVYLHVSRKNSVALKMYENLGFVYEGEFIAEYFIQGAFQDVLRLRLLASEWEKIIKQSP
ncbi:MAG: GNAT family protein [Deltaproteobacteria bacterium]|jgi:RimJ/RimL family protein N-acetyltransferase